MKHRPHRSFGPIAPAERDAAEAFWNALQGRSSIGRRSSESVGGESFLEDVDVPRMASTACFGVAPPPPASEVPRKADPMLAPPSRRGVMLMAPRPTDEAPQGRTFVRDIWSMELGPERERKIEAQLLAGNIPSFLRHLEEVTVNSLGQPTKAGEPAALTFWVTPDFLAVGSDDDYVLMPMGLPIALNVAKRYGCVLPTDRMVDAIYSKADRILPPEAREYWKLKPNTLAHKRQTSICAYWEHDQAVKRNRVAAGARPYMLVEGHKKTLVADVRQDDALHLYGWGPKGHLIEKNNGATNHFLSYADYSHGIRLVRNMVRVGDELRPIMEVLTDPDLCSLLTNVKQGKKTLVFTSDWPPKVENTWTRKENKK